MRSATATVKILYFLISIANASFLIFEFYDTVDPVHRQVERYCVSKNHTEQNLCKLLRNYDGPCKDAINKKSCIYKQCKSAEMSTMPICKKLRSKSRRSLPLMLKIFNV